MKYSVWKEILPGHQTQKSKVTSPGLEEFQCQRTWLQTLRPGFFVHHAGGAFTIPYYFPTGNACGCKDTLASLLIIPESNLEPRGRNICQQVDEKLR